MTHAEVGFWLLKKWALPDELVYPIAYHHAFHPRRDHADRTAIVHVADILCRALNLGYPGDGRIPPPHPEALAMINLPMHEVRGDLPATGSRRGCRRPPMIDARVILDLLPKPVGLVDGAVLVLEANRAFATRFGLARPGVATGGRQSFWDGLARAIGRLQPAARHGTFRWGSADANSRPYDVHVTRVGEDQFLVVADDVSPYVEVEEIQGGVRRYVESILNHIEPAVIVLDERLHVTFFNESQAALLERAGIGSTPIDIVGEPVTTVFPVFDAARWTALGGELRAGRALRHERVRWPAGDGVWLDVSVVGLDGPGQPVTGAICVSEVVDPAPTGQSGGAEFAERAAALHDRLVALRADPSLGIEARAHADAALALARRLAGRA